MIRALSLTVLMMLLAPAVCLSASPPSAQAPAAAAPQAPAADPAPGTTAKSGEAPAPSAVEPQGYSYDRDGRRDPFVSLLRRGTDMTRNTSGTRPPGLAGLATGEVTLSGIMASRGGFVAMLQGVDKKTYIVRSGDRLLDGTVRAINADTMVILQQVNDPLSLEKQREVRKVLRQTEEAK